MEPIFQRIVITILNFANYWSLKCAIHLVWARGLSNTGKARTCRGKLYSMVLGLPATTKGNPKLTEISHIYKIIYS